MYFCKECGNESKKWYGKCPSCKQYNTLVEVKEEKMYPSGNGKPIKIDTKDIKLEKLKDVQSISKTRVSSKIKELDYVLGGGLIEGSLLLIGGSPGVGKSTLTMQVACNIGEDNKILYISGEESPSQIKLRANRVTSQIPDNLLIANIKNLEQIQKVALENNVQFLIVDSIQTIYSSNNNTISGSIGQLKECTLKLMYFAKENNITIITIGHITKDGEIAGPKLLEHMVDVVLYLETEKNTGYKILRSQKNRFGKVGEIGLFEMKENGLISVNTLQIDKDKSIKEVEGLTFSMLSEGNRIFVVEVQTLTVPTLFGYPKRVTQGYDVQRLNLILGLLYKRLKLDYSRDDCYLNLSLAFKQNIMLLDLAVIAALISIKKNKLIKRNIIFLGEVSLTGEIKEVPCQLEMFTEAKKLGFKVIYCNNHSNIEVSGIKIIDIKNIDELNF